MLCADASRWQSNQYSNLLSWSHALSSLSPSGLYDCNIDEASKSHLIAHFISHSFSLGMCTIIYLLFFFFSFLFSSLSLLDLPPTNWFGLKMTTSSCLSISLSLPPSCVRLCLCAWMNEMNAQSKPCECSHLLCGSFFFFFFFYFFYLLFFSSH